MMVYPPSHALPKERCIIDYDLTQQTLPSHKKCGMSKRLLYRSWKRGISSWKELWENITFCKANKPKHIKNSYSRTIKLPYMKAMRFVNDLLENNCPSRSLLGGMERLSHLPPQLGCSHLQIHTKWEKLC